MDIENLSDSFLKIENKIFLSGYDIVLIPVKAKSKVVAQTEVKPAVSKKTLTTTTQHKLKSTTDSNVNIHANMNSNAKVNSDVTGTFYAEKLYWSAENNELYFQGKSTIAFGENNYVSDSSAIFLGKVYFLVINGTIVKLEGKAKKDFKLSQKKYNLTHLSPNSAVKKYGEEGRKGAIEISLAK